jgi:hypothetical protein
VEGWGYAIGRGTDFLGGFMKTNFLATFTASAFLAIGSPALAGSLSYFEIDNFVLALFEWQGIITSIVLFLAVLALGSFAISSDDLWKTWKSGALKLIVVSVIQFFSLSLICFFFEKPSETLVCLAIWNLLFALILSTAQAIAPSSCEEDIFDEYYRRHSRAKQPSKGADRALSERSKRSVCGSNDESSDPGMGSRDRKRRHSKDDCGI